MYGIKVLDLGSDKNAEWVMFNGTPVVFDTLESATDKAFTWEKAANGTKVFSPIRYLGSNRRSQRRKS